MIADCMRNKKGDFGVKEVLISVAILLIAAVITLFLYSLINGKLGVWADIFKNFVRSGG